jgi:sugar (pentulose or hexulose) kinase
LTGQAASVRLLGIDAGTTSMKAAVFDLSGRLLGIDRQEYQLLMPSANIVELDAELYWQACRRAIRNALRQSDTDASQVTALSISSQGETLICLDKNGAPTRNAIAWLDNRATDEAGLIARQFGVEHVFQITGQADVAPTWPACKILWIRRNEPAVFDGTSRFLLLEDYLLYRLTGEYVTERCLQADTLLLDIRSGNWWQPMFDFVGIVPERLGRLMWPGEVVGPLSRAGAENLGLSTKTVAVTGAMDQMMGAVGAGNFLAGVATESTGGALAIIVTLPTGKPCQYHAWPDTYCLMPWAQTAGMALKWFRDQFFYLESQVAYASNLDPYDLMTRAASDVPAGADGLVVLPHLEGAACPEFNPAAKAVFFGATLRHTKAHFIRAILESVAYMLKKNLDLVEGLGIPVREVRSIGGGARSASWLQIKADVLQKPVVTVEVEEAALLGAALLAAVATGSFADLPEGVARMVRLRERVEPNARRADIYREGYAQYVELYERLAPMFRGTEDVPVF